MYTLYVKIDFLIINFHIIMTIYMLSWFINIAVKIKIKKIIWRGFGKILKWSGRNMSSWDGTANIWRRYLNTHHNDIN